MVNRNASPVLFGFDFQVNAAIILMIDNIKDMAAIRMEGQEDIEMELNNGSYILAQAKSAVKGSTDFSNALQNFKEAMVSLSDANQVCPSTVKQLIYISNYANPLTVASEKHLFAGLPARRNYHDLPQKSQNKIDELFSKLEYPLDKSKLVIQTFPFETDDDKERYKFVIQAIKDFLSTIESISIDSYELHRIWKDDIFKSGTKKSKTLKVLKTDIVWPIIVLITNNNSNYYYDDYDIDDSEIEEISRLYSGIINSISEKYEFVTRVLYAYNDFREGKGREKVKRFVDSNYHNFLYLLDDTSIDVNTKSILIKIILRSIIAKRIQIDKIKKVTNL